MNTPSKDYTMEKLVRGVCKQISAFTVSVRSSVTRPHHDLLQTEAQANGDPGYAWLMFGQEGGITTDQLVLVSIRRVTTGTWVPVVRLVNAK